MDTWRPIETAPKDGTVVLVYDPNSWFKDPINVDWYSLNPDTFGWCGTPTHWMPLPAPPQEAGTTRRIYSWKLSWN